MIRWWMPLAFGVGLCAVANAVLIATAVRVRPEKLVERPYADSAFEDERSAERAAFAAAGWRLEAAVDGDACVLRIAGAAPPAAGVVRVYRPDDRSADRQVPWTDPAQPLRLDLARAGVWVIDLSCASAGGTVAAATTRVRVGAGR